MMQVRHYHLLTETRFRFFVETLDEDLAVEQIVILSSYHHEIRRSYRVVGLDTAEGSVTAEILTLDAEQAKRLPPSAPPVGGASGMRLAISSRGEK